MIIVWIILIAVAFAAGAVTSSVVTLRRLPVIIGRMSDAAREQLLDQVEAVERGRTD